MHHNFPPPQIPEVYIQLLQTGNEVFGAIHIYNEKVAIFILVIHLDSNTFKSDLVFSETVIFPFFQLKTFN